MNILKKIIFVVSAGALFCLSVLVFGVAGCSGNGNKHLNGDGNSVWAFLPKLDDKDSKFDSADVWREVLPFLYGHGNKKITDPSLWDPEQRGKLSLKLLKILSVSLLSNWKTVEQDLSDADWADYDLLASRMHKAWTDLVSNTDNYIARQKQDYKNKYGKNWSKKWQDMLKDKYDSSEKKYKADLLASGTDDNASIELSNLLLNRDQKSYVTSSPQTIKNNFQSFKTSGQQWGEWAQQNPDMARLIVLSSTSYLNQEGKVSELWKKDETGQLMLTDVVAWSGAGTFAPRYSVSNRQYNSTTDQYEARQLSQGSYSGGLISEFQKFIVGKWFQWTKPLAISSVTFEYSKNIPGGRTGLYNGLFAGKTPGEVTVQDLFQTDVVNKIETVLGQLTSQPWTSLSTQQLVTPTYDEKLMTIAGGGKKPPKVKKGDKPDTPDDYRRTAVYSNMSSFTSGENPPGFTKYLSDETYLSGLLDSARSVSVGRGNQSQMAQVFAIGPKKNTVRDRVLVYFDEKGLNLVHIDGLWAVLQQNKGQGQKKFDYQDKIAKNSDRPAAYDRFENYIQPQITNGVADTAIIKDGKWSFNSVIGSLYQQYLVNRSYVNLHGKGMALTNFNVFDSINAFAVLDKDSTFGNNLWYSWIYDFYNYYFTDLVTPSLPDWFDQFMKFDPDHKDHKWFDQALRNHDAELSLHPVTAFATAINKLNKSIRDADAKPGEYPEGQFFDDKKVLDAILSVLIANTEPIGSKGSWFWYNGGLNE